MSQINNKEEKLTEKISNDDMKSEKGVKQDQSIHVGPEVKCDKIDIVQTNNNFCIEESSHCKNSHCIFYY